MSHPIPFPEHNRTLQPPKGMTEEECTPLEVYSDGERCISCWKLTPDEMMQVLQDGVIWVHVWSGETQPPISVHAGSPFAPEDTDDESGHQPGD